MGRAFVSLVTTLNMWAADGVHGAAEFTSGLRFSVTDERSDFSINIGRDIVLHARRAVDAQGRHFGWDFSATDRRLAESPNYFYECRCGHGPRPHDLYAWHFVEQYYPSERILPVYGYPFEVRIQCMDCQVTGSGGTEAHFAAGTVDVSWRRLAASNPRQLRISDIVGVAHRPGRNG